MGISGILLEGKILTKKQGWRSNIMSIFPIMGFTFGMVGFIFGLIGFVYGVTASTKVISIQKRLDDLENKS